VLMAFAVLLLLLPPLLLLLQTACKLPCPRV
jgi:hypothetical protein